MNRSFSKKRHISEANSILEKRYLSNAIFEQNTGASTEIWKNYPCVINHPDKKEFKLKDGSQGYRIDNFNYYSNGRYQDESGKMNSYACQNGGIVFLNAKRNEDPKKTDSISNNRESQWVPCSDNFKMYCYNKKEIGRLQSCLGGVKVDGYFGTRTLKALNAQYPGYKGVVKKTDIDTICNAKTQSSPAYQATDNVDPDKQPTTTQVTQPTDGPDVYRDATPADNSVENLPQLQRRNAGVSTQRNIPNIQQSLQTKQRVANDYQKKFNDLKRRNPGMSTAEINARLGYAPNNQSYAGG